MAARGRPAYKPTAAQRRHCEELVSCGMGEEAIARVFGIARGTLRAHFADELLFGLERRRSEVVKLLFKSARGGNVTAQKKLHEMTGIAAAEKSFVEPTRPEVEAKAPKVGKKEEAALAATTAGQGTEWGSDLDVGPVRSNRVN